MSQLGYKRLVPGKGQQLTLLSLEVHAASRQASVLCSWMIVLCVSCCKPAVLRWHTRW